MQQQSLQFKAVSFDNLHYPDNSNHCQRLAISTADTLESAAIKDLQSLPVSELKLNIRPGGISPKNVTYNSEVSPSCLQSTPACNFLLESPGSQAAGLASPCWQNLVTPFKLQGGAVLPFTPGTQALHQDCHMPLERTTLSNNNTTTPSVCGGLGPIACAVGTSQSTWRAGTGLIATGLGLKLAQRNQLSLSPVADRALVAQNATDTACGLSNHRTQFSNPNNSNNKDQWSGHHIRLPSDLVDWQHLDFASNSHGFRACVISQRHAGGIDTTGPRRYQRSANDDGSAKISKLGGAVRPRAVLLDHSLMDTAPTWFHSLADKHSQHHGLERISRGTTLASGSPRPELAGLDFGLDCLELTGLDLDHKHAAPSSESLPSDAMKRLLEYLQVLSLDASMDKYLFISKQPIGVLGCRAVGQFLSWAKGIRVITLTHAHITDEGVAELAAGLLQNADVALLDLRRNSIGDAGAAMLAECLKTCEGLRDLELSGNMIGDEGARSLAEALHACKAVKRVRAADNAMSQAAAEQLQAAHRKHKVPRPRLPPSLASEILYGCSDDRQPPPGMAGPPPPEHAGLGCDAPRTLQDLMAFRWSRDFEPRQGMLQAQPGQQAPRQQQQQQQQQRQPWQDLQFQVVPDGWGTAAVPATGVGGVFAPIQLQFQDAWLQPTGPATAAFPPVDPTVTTRMSTCSGGGGPEQLAAVLKLLVEPAMPCEHEVAVQVQAVMEAVSAASRQQVEVDGLAQALADLGYHVELTTSLGGGAGTDCLQNLRHRFITVSVPDPVAAAFGSLDGWWPEAYGVARPWDGEQPHHHGAAEELGGVAEGLEGGGDGLTTPHTRIIVDVMFRDQFEIGRPTERYRALLAVLPQVYVGQEDRIPLVVEMLCDEMVLAFKAARLPLPPWRQAPACLTRWRPRQATRAKVTPGDTCAAAAVMPEPVTQGPAAGVAMPAAPAGPTPDTGADAGATASNGAEAEAPAPAPASRALAGEVSVADDVIRGLKHASSTTSCTASADSDDLGLTSQASLPLSRASSSCYACAVVQLVHSAAGDSNGGSSGSCCCGDEGDVDGGMMTDGTAFGLDGCETSSGYSLGMASVGTCSMSRGRHMVRVNECVSGGGC